MLHDYGKALHYLHIVNEYSVLSHEYGELWIMN